MKKTFASLKRAPGDNPFAKPKIILPPAVEELNRPPINPNVPPDVIVNPPQPIAPIPPTSGPVYLSSLPSVVVTGDLGKCENLEVIQVFAGATPTSIPASGEGDLSYIENNKCVLVAIGFQVFHTNVVHALTRFAFAIWAPIDALIPKANHRVDENEMRNRYSRWIMQVGHGDDIKNPRGEYARAKIQEWAQKGVRVVSPFGGAALGNYDAEGDSTIMSVYAGPESAFSSLIVDSFRCSQIDNLTFSVENVFTGEKGENMVIGHRETLYPNLGKFRFPGTGYSNDGAYIQKLDFVWANNKGIGHGIRGIKSVTYLSGMRPLLVPVSENSCCLENDVALAVRSGTLQEMRCMYQNNYRPKAAWNCAEKLLPFCSINMLHPDCKKNCANIKDLNCDGALQIFCTKTLNDLEARFPGQGLEKLMANPDFLSVCACSLPDEIYKNFFADLKKQSGQQGLSEYKECYFPGCSRNLKYLYAHKQKTLPTCQAIQSCTSQLTLGNNGKISGNVNNKNIQNCFNGSESGSTSGADTGKKSDEDKNEDDDEDEDEDEDNDKNKNKTFGLETWQVATGAGILVALILLFMYSRSK
jgi:hypothetical protein